MSRKLALFIALTLGATGSLAQTVISNYKPGVTSEGAVYYLPKTAIRITLQIEKTTYTPGEFCKYSEKYLRIKDVASTPSTKYRLISVQQEPFAVADTSKCYAVKYEEHLPLLFDEKRRESLIESYSALLFQKGVRARYRDLLTGEEFSGVIEGVEADGRLRIREGKRLRYYRFKEVGYIL